MNQNEKIELLKDAIRQLFEKEGKSRVYISKLLGVNRQELGKKITEWGFKYTGRRRPKPSTLKFINSNKQKIISMLQEGKSCREIGEYYKMTEDSALYIIHSDDELNNILENRNTLRHINAEKNAEESKSKSARDYNVIDADGEEWKPILGYESYFVSNLGRVKKYCKRYKSYYLLKPSANIISKRLYVALSKNDSVKNMQLARIVANTFIPHDIEKNTVNHKNGDVTDNRVENLEWVTQSENNKHAYDCLKRTVNKSKRLDYFILYKKKYQFKTIQAFATFMGLSWTQAKRKLDEPSKHEIELIERK